MTTVEVEVELDHTKTSQVEIPYPVKVKTSQLSSDVYTGNSSNQENDAEARTSDEESNQPPYALADVPDVMRIPYPITKAAWIVIMVGSLERMAFYGGSTPFQNYIQRSGDQGHPGRLGKGQVAATALNQYL